MSLAKFFDKSVLAASEILSGFSYLHFEQVLKNVIVQIGYDSKAASTFEGQCALDMSVRLLARLYPTLSIKALDDEANSILPGLVKVARDINPEITILTHSDKANITLVIGEKPFNGDVVYYIGSENWVAKFSSKSPVGCQDSANPLGAGAAACFGAANIFRFLFKTQLFEGEPDGPFSISLLNNILNPDASNNPVIETCNLGQIPIVGIGAIGNAIVWGLSKVKGISGELHLIDPEKIELSNLQRYVNSLFADIGLYKSDSAVTKFDSLKIKAISYKCKWAEYLAMQSSFALETVVVSVDSAKARCEIQASLSRKIFNAWTQLNDLGVSRHDFLSEEACLMCLYLPDGEVPSEDQEIASALNMTDPQSLYDIRERLFKNIPVDQQFLQQIAVAKNVPFEPLCDFVGHSLREFYSRAICGGMLLTLNPSSIATGQPVPMAFQSALAGIMLACDVIADKANLRKEAPPTTTRINLLKPITQHLNFPEKKHPSKRCICKDEDFIAAYKSKWQA